MEMLGTADRVVVMKDSTTIVSDGKNSEAVTARIAQIRKDAETADSDVRASPLYDLFFRKHGTRDVRSP